MAAPMTVAVAVLVSLAGCGSDDAPLPATPSPVSSPPAVGALPRSDDPTRTPGSGQTTATGFGQPESGGRTGEIVWTIESDPATGAPLADLESIDPNAPRIVAVLPVTRSAAPALASATWSYNNTPMPAFDAQAQIPAGEGTLWLAFALEAPPGSTWPAGAYQVLVAIDGAPAAIGTVEVRAGT